MLHNTVKVSYDERDVESLMVVMDMEHMLEQITAERFSFLHRFLTGQVAATPTVAREALDQVAAALARCIDVADVEMILGHDVEQAMDLLGQLYRDSEQLPLAV